MVVLKSEENKIFQEMQAYISAKRMSYNELSKKIEESPEDSSLAIQLKSQMKEIDEEVKAYQNTLAAQNEGTFASRMIKAMQKPIIPDSLIGDGEDLLAKRYNYYRDHYFDGVEIADPGLLRTPVLNQKVLDYFDNVIVQIPDTVIKEVDWFLSEAIKDAEVYRYALVTLTSKYESSPIMGLDEVFVHIVENYYLKGSADWVDDETHDKLAERIATMKPNFLGNQAPPLSLNDTLFSTIKLYDINTDYTVLYFYDPDCGHCKKKTPVLYEAYSKLRNQSVEVLAICITTDTDRWKEYIRDNSFDWVNLADSYGKSNFRYYYDIRSTPIIYILDKDKKIIAKKLDATQVESFITQMQDLQSRSN
jgi:peroxiredoxin